jgi:hypothetical protein
VLAGPTTGAAATPTFRALVASDIPTLSYVTSVSGTSGRITSTGGTTPVIDLASGVATPGTTGSSTLVPVITIDTYGRVTSITTAANPQGTVTSVGGTGTVNGITLTGTVTSSGNLTLGGTLGGIGNSQLTNSTISGVALGSNLFDLTAGTGVSFSSGTTYNGSAAITITATGSGGTVTSVTGTSPVVSSGGTTPAISLATAYGDTLNPYASKTANYVLAAPNGSAGVPTFRALVAADVPGSALTKTDDTNVTLTLGGSPTTALLNAASLTLGWTGQLGISRGGTNTSTAPSAYGVVYGNSGGTAYTSLTNGTTGQVLTATTSGAPSWAAPAYTGTVTSVSFTGGLITVATATTTPALTVAGTSGGIPYFSSANTWASSAALTQYGVVYGGGAGAMPVATAAGTTGQVLTATTGGAPTWAAPATSGTVTSVAALTLGTTGTDLSSTVANGSTTPVITLQVPTASASNRGALSSTDWTTFNSKAPATTYTTNYIPYGQGTTTPNQSSNLQFNGTNLGIGGAAATTTGVKIATTQSGVNQFGIDNNAVMSGTTNSFVYRSVPSVLAGTTVATFTHININTASLGAASVIGIQNGINIADLTAGSGNTNGINLNISSASGKYNIYAAGTASSYFAGGINIGATADPGANNLNVVGYVTRTLESTLAAAPTIASATTIAPTKLITFISGTTSIATITAPSPISSTGGQITLIPTGLFVTLTTGNIALASTAVLSKALIMTYDSGTAKWYPSY